MTLPDALECPPWCEWHEDTGVGWMHARTLLEDEVQGLRVQLSGGGMMEGEPVDPLVSLKVLAPGEHIVMQATSALLASFRGVVEAAAIV